MLLKENTYNVIVRPHEIHTKLYDVKLVVDEVIDINILIKAIETYGIQLEGVSQDFINYVVRSSVGLDTEELIVANPLVRVPIKIKSQNKQIVFVDEGKNNLRIFVR